MATGDHRYARDRWSTILSAVVQSPDHRMRLVRDPERASELWGFCSGGRAFLRLLNALATTVGEEPIQKGTDRFLETYARHPEPLNRIARQIGLACRLPALPDSIDQIAKALGYRPTTGSARKKAIRRSRRRG